MIQTITPDDARKWLRNSRQRNVDMNRVRTLIEAMESGSWDIKNIPNDPIRIKDGGVEDGNHRLMAVLIHGEPTEVKLVIQ
jgi:hypothetical protein